MSGCYIGDGNCVIGGSNCVIRVVDLPSELLFFIVFSSSSGKKGLLDFEPADRDKNKRQRDKDKNK